MPAPGPRFGSRLAFKIVLPFALLTMAIGAAGTLAATHALSTRGQESFDNQLIHDGFVAQSELGTQDSERRAVLRLLAGGPALPQAWTERSSLQMYLERALAVHPNTIVETIDRDGRELVGVSGQGPGQDIVTGNRDLTSWPGVEAMLSGGQDRLDVVTPGSMPAIFTGQLVRDGKGLLLGAILVGDALADSGSAIKAAVHDEVTFYDTHGQVLSTTAGLAADRWPTLGLDAPTRDRVSPTSVVQITRDLGGPGVEMVAPWSARGETFGYVGVVASSAGLLAGTGQLRLLMAGLFVLGVILVLLIGIWLARRIARPVQALVEATRLVSAGDLDHQAAVTSHDEIGELTASFNLMTRSLKEKSTTLQATMNRLQDTYLMTIEALAAAVEARDPHTHGHTQRVGDYAVLMAKTMGVDEAEIQAVRRASVLHDIGKIGIEDRILRKQARLEPDEELRMQRHPVIGVDMLKGIDFLESVLPIIRHHHERWDGNGYPDQLRQDEVPLGARILAVADALDAMTSDRPYRAARTFEFAKAEILKGSATHFDPEVVTAFIRSQRDIEDLLRRSADSAVHEHPQPDDLGGWRLHVVGR